LLVAGVNHEAAKAVHRALSDSLDEGEIAISWVVTIDVAGPDDVRYLAHRAGGGADGTDAPMSWQALGMLEASANLAADQVRECTISAEDEEDEDQ
jgi:hypothetical protein